LTGIDRNIRAAAAARRPAGALGLDRIEQTDGGIDIGGTTTLDERAGSPHVAAYAAVAASGDAGCVAAPA
jgi:hypothetical protein